MSNFNLADKYYLKALENFHYSHEEAVEGLGYALSYDDEHARAWCLQGRMMMEIMKDFTEAEKCFELALLYDPKFVDTYKHYSLLLLWTAQFAKAKNVLDKAAKVPGMPLTTLQNRWSMWYEFQGQVGKAIKLLEQSIILSTCDTSYTHFTSEIKRLKKKISKPRKVKSIKQAKVDEVRLSWFKTLSKVVAKWIF